MRSRQALEEVLAHGKLAVWVGMLVVCAAACSGDRHAGETTVPEKHASPGVGSPGLPGKPVAMATRPPERFNGRIPPDLPPVPMGVDGTRFIPDPFFYGEETWDGLEIRLQLYLAYQYKDLAVVDVAQNRLDAALDRYRRLEQRLTARPVDEVILRDIHEALLDWARRAQCVLLVRLGDRNAASTCLMRVHWGTGKGEAAWRDFLQGALRGVTAGETGVEGSLAAVAARYRELLPGPPWTPRATGPAPTMADRHRDRLDRVHAYVVWFDPLATRQPWGVYGPAQTQRALWARAIAATLAAHLEPASRRAALSALLDGLVKAPDIAVARAQLEPLVQAAGPVDPMDALVTAETAAQTRDRVQPHTSADLIQGMPTGDSYLDLLGQAGSPPVGKTEKLSLDDPEHRAWTAHYVDAINNAIAEGRTGDIAPLLQKMIRELDAYPFDSRYFNIKRVRNEGIRLLVLTGQPDRALSLLDGFFPLQDLDYRVPCRQGVLEAVRGRILLEAGKLDKAREAFSRALGHTERWLGYMDRYRGRAGGPLGPAAVPNTSAGASRH